MHKMPSADQISKAKAEKDNSDVESIISQFTEMAKMGGNRYNGINPATLNLGTLGPAQRSRKRSISSFHGGATRSLTNAPTTNYMANDPTVGSYMKRKDDDILSRSVKNLNVNRSSRKCMGNLTLTSSAALI